MSTDKEEFGGFSETRSTVTRVVDCITITKGSQFNFPTAVYRKNKLERFKAVKLFYNKIEHKVAFEFLETPQEGSFRLVPSGENGKYGFYCLSKSFFYLNDIKPVSKFAGRYEYIVTDKTTLGSTQEGRVFVIDLNLKQEKGGIREND